MSVGGTLPTGGPGTQVEAGGPDLGLEPPGWMGARATPRACYSVCLKMGPGLESTGLRRTATGVAQGFLSATL